MQNPGEPCSSLPPFPTPMTTPTTLHHTNMHSLVVMMRNYATIKVVIYTRPHMHGSGAVGPITGLLSYRVTPSDKFRTFGVRRQFYQNCAKNFTKKRTGSRARLATTTSIIEIRNHYYPFL